MNLRQCEIFRAVMTTSSITEAADRLGITQPAVSKMLAQTERDLGFPLFLRERRRLVPTPEAQALFKEVERAFLGLEHLTRFARDLKGLRQGHLVLGAPYAAAAGWLPGVVAGFLRQHPGLSLSLRTMNSLSVAQSLAAGHLDLGLVQFEVPAPGVQRECLLPVEAVCVLPPATASRPARFSAPWTCAMNPWWRWPRRTATASGWRLNWRPGTSRPASGWMRRWPRQPAPW